MGNSLDGKQDQEAKVLPRPKGRHDSALDGARGLAVLMVVFSHASKLGIPTDSILNLRGTGRYGVFLFFVLSSFLLTRQIMVATKRELRSFTYWLNYGFRRFLRIFPAFSMSLVLYIFFYKGGVGKFPATADDLVSHLMLQEGMAVFWTIPVEFKYYMLLPAVALIFRAMSQDLAGWRGGLFFCFTVGIVSWLKPPQFGISLWSYIPVFLCGAFAAFVVLWIERLPRSVRGGCSVYPQLLTEIAGWLGILFVVLLVPCFLSRLLGREVGYTSFHLWYVPFGIASSAVVVACMAGTGAMRRLLSWPPLVAAGRISYSLYLLHMLVMSWAVAVTESTVCRLVLFFTCSAVLASISYCTIERPFSRIRIT
ncbi:MAG: acyltransferase [Desulfobulbaceae bacterium]|nr:acyltransferase [Desulfobulbaceae bacterium]